MLRGRIHGWGVIAAPAVEELEQALDVVEVETLSSIPTSPRRHADGNGLFSFGGSRG